MNMEKWLEMMTGPDGCLDGEWKKQQNTFLLGLSVVARFFYHLACVILYFAVVLLVAGFPIALAEYFNQPWLNALYAIHTAAAVWLMGENIR